LDNKLACEEWELQQEAVGKEELDRGDGVVAHNMTHCKHFMRVLASGAWFCEKNFTEPVAHLSTCKWNQHFQ